MIEVKVQSVAFDRKSKTPVVILKDPGSDRVLPIWIGPAEASAIAMHLGGISFKRPLTHDLLAAVLGGLGGRLDRVVITRVKESTYFAEMIIERAGDIISIDGRPSDCIAVALRASASIYADDGLLEAMVMADEDEDGQEEDDASMRGEALEDHLRDMRPEDLGRFEP